MMRQTDLFNEQRVVIPDNKPLEEAANLILYLVKHNSALLDGETMGEIDRAIMAEAWLDAGLKKIVRELDIVRFRQWINELPSCYDTDVLRRARRWLLEHDAIRVSKEAILNAEKQKAKIASSFRG